MRVNEEFIKSGFFWLPNAPQNKFAGTLCIQDGGDIKLELVGDLSFPNNPEAIDRINGHIENVGFVTIDECISTGITINNIIKARFIAHKVLCHMPFDDNDNELAFNTIRFSVEGLEKWISISGIEIDRANFEPNYTLKYKLPSAITHSINDDCAITIGFQCKQHSFAIPSDFKIEQKTYLEVTYKNEVELDELISIASKITSFICLATDEIVNIQDVSVQSHKITEEISGIKRPINIQLYYPSASFSEQIPNIYPHKFLFNYHDIKGNFGNFIHKWLEVYDISSPTLFLYFSAKSDTHRYLDGKFMALVQGIETFHRRINNHETLMDKSVFDELVDSLISSCPEEHQKWLEGRLKFGNEIPLMKRISAIIEPFKSHFGGKRRADRLAGKIVVTRNYMTHYDPNLETRVAKGRDLLNLCYKIESLIQLHLLNIIGFDYETIDKIIIKNRLLKQKLDTV
ncbi:TPA: HEPN domain-containing protein [Vibrio harveyi]